MPFRRPPPPRWSVCGRRTDEQGPLPQENHSCLLFSHAAGGRHSIRPSPSRRARPSGLDSGVPAMLCVCSVFVLGVFLSVCKKGGLGARFALARHRSAAACIWSWVLGLGSCCGCLFAQPTSSFRSRSRQSSWTGVSMTLPWREGCSQRPWGRPREGREGESSCGQEDGNPIHAHHKHSNSGSSGSAVALARHMPLRYRPSVSWFPSFLIDSNRSVDRLSIFLGDGREAWTE